ncbi:Hypothetical protein Bdt_1765 [Bdellovibrio bacteriovorus str. Tiberius]|uniref:Uncharacterized protein n=1 Tax=Bdellovibrio bacteriovorus str. Tiberius TaxID=1069642 RepID=K7YXN4_BDEBC|nr:Hypothetical protein Bdt_1765 [Bdellovibrio bacteriovorus str. Tiberius]
MGVVAGLKKKKPLWGRLLSLRQFVEGFFEFL